MSEDLRVIKTRSNIRKEFLSLLEQYEFRAITVSMVMSGVRSTVPPSIEIMRINTHWLMPLSRIFWRSSAGIWKLPLSGNPNRGLALSILCWNIFRSTGKN